MSEQANRSEISSQGPVGETPEAVPTPGDTGLGGCAEASAAAAVPRPLAAPRLRTADRQQILPPISLDQLVEPDHPARSVWRFAEGLDLSLLYDRIRSRENTPGRPATDPRVLVALWLYAILYGVISARRLEDLCTYHNAFRWLKGGAPVNHHLLSDFLVEHLDFLEELFTHSVAVLQLEGLVDLDRVGQDGMRVRASAGAASFRRVDTLERLLKEAKANLQKLQQQVDESPQEVEKQEVEAEKQEPGNQPEEASKHKQAAQKRAAEEAVERVEQALARMPEMEAKKDAKDKDKARVSTTDAEATVMKMGDGGYRPAYNIQFSTTCDKMVIVGVEVVTTGSDQGQLPPMLEQIEERFDKRPEEALVDGGYAKHEDIESVQSGEGDKAQCKVYAPVPKPKKDNVDRYAEHAGDSPEVAEWRQRMGTDEAKEIYKERAATAECVNAQARNRGLIRLLVRGLQKVKAVAYWFAIVHNMARGFALLPLPATTAALPC